MVCVDMLIDYGWKLGPSCHMVSDKNDMEELNAFALKIGLKLSWFQKGDKVSLPHYDLTASKRKLAVANGAKELNRKELSEISNEYRKLQSSSQNPNP